MELKINDKNELSSADEELSTLIVPSTAKKILKYSFTWNKDLKRVVTNEGLEDIGEHAFMYCRNLQEVHLSSTINKIGKFCFCMCFKLKSIEIPKNVSVIEYSTFNNCIRLEKVVLPENLKTIKEEAFSDCTRLFSINVPDSVTSIEGHAFINCRALETINIPKNLTEINEYVFHNCVNLKSVVLPDGLKVIKESSFYNCKALKDIYIPNTVRELGAGCFSNNSSLVNVKLSENITILPSSSFYSCSSIKKIKIPTSTIEIGENCFHYCTSLKEVKLNDNLKYIAKAAFESCKALKSIDFPDSLEIIEDYAFFDCSSLNKIIIPSSVTSIGENAFGKCTNITEISLPKNIVLKKNVFGKLKKCHKVSLYNSSNLLDKEIRDFLIKNINRVYYNKNTGQIIIYSKRHEEKLDGFERINHEEYKKYFGCSNEAAMILTFISKTTNKDIKQLRFLSSFINDISLQENIDTLYKIVTNTNNYIEYNKLLKRLFKTNINNGIEYFKLFKFANNLGAFDDDQIVRQKACNFIENLFDKNILTLELCDSLLNNMNYGKYNQGWAKFVMENKNMIELIKNDQQIPSFFARSYNEYDEIREFYRRNRGHNAYRNITLEACENYLSAVEFTNVTIETLDIVPYLQSYTRYQSSFDKARKIREEYLKLKREGKINDHILGEPLEEKNVFERIDEVRHEIICDSSKVLDKLNELSNNRFTYEFLSKYDPKNFVLGRYCTCCADIERVGFGIMKASILHPDCQNLVIKDHTGRIVAKSTLYVNRKRGYGIFNNVEVNDNISEKDKELIYKKYKKAVIDFVKRYNEINKNNPIKQINVGTSINDLSGQIRRNNLPSVILEGIDFSEYGDVGKNYTGDWQAEQYVLWKAK